MNQKLLPILLTIVGFTSAVEAFAQYNKHYSWKISAECIDDPCSCKNSAYSYLGMCPNVVTSIEFANPNLKNCVAALPVKPGVARDPAEFDCIPTATDANGNLKNAADQDYKNWKDVLFEGKSKVPVTGAYRLNGQRCGDQTSASCPIAVRAKFVISCNEGDTKNYDQATGKCAVASKIKVYRALYQEVQIPGQAPIKSMVFADNSMPSTAAASIIPMNKITAETKGEYKCSDLKQEDGAPYFQKGEDAYGYPICEKDTTVEIMREQICKQMMQKIWREGGPSEDPCEIVKISKVFKLTNPNSSGTNTSDCIKAGGGIFDSNGNQVTNLNVYPGGAISDKNNMYISESTFSSKYGISTPSPTFVCKKKNEGPKGESFSPASTQTESKTYTINLPSNFVPGSLTAIAVGGGGGGASSSGYIGGKGGHPGKSESKALTGVTTPGTSCSITVGAGGVGKDETKRNKTYGTNGTSSSINCGSDSNQSLTASGSNQNTTDDEGGVNGGGCGGGAGYDAPINPNTSLSYGLGGTKAGDCSHGNAAPATSYGAGGSGGNCSGSTCTAKNGGHGAGGYVEIGYKVYEWTDW
jgi:hypothetical protein